MLKKLGYVAIGLAIWFAGMFVGQTQSPDATAVKQNGMLEAEIASGTAAFEKVCAGVEVQNKTMIAFGVPSSSVNFHCSVNPFVSKE